MSAHPGMNGAANIVGYGVHVTLRRMNSPSVEHRDPLHVLVLPKWYPGRKDPQLGDFIRKQTLAVARKARVSVVFVSPIEGLGAFEEQELTTTDGPWELRSYYRPSAATLGPWRKAINYLRYRRAFRNGIARMLTERGRPDLSHVHILVRPAAAAWWLYRTRGIPYLLSEQSSEYLDGTWAAKGALFKAFNRFLFRHAGAVTAVSAHLGRGLERLGLCTRYEVVPNVVPGTDRLLPAPGEAGRFMMVADLVDRTKNVSGVLRALHAARGRGHDLRLDVIGDGPDRDALQAEAASLGLNGSVRWLGRLPNAAVLDHMGGTGTVIINSNVETFSVVTGEALACGKPVIATRCGGPEAFITPENGVLIPPKDDDALAEAMIAMERGHDRYDPATIRRTVSDRFGPEAVGDRFLSIYQRVLGHG